LRFFLSVHKIVALLVPVCDQVQVCPLLSCINCTNFFVNRCQILSRIQKVEDPTGSGSTTVPGVVWDCSGVPGFVPKCVGTVTKMFRSKRHYISVPDPGQSEVWIQIWLWILLSSSKNSKKILSSYCLLTSFGLFIFEK
jgi:hypothetical protein